MSRRKKKTLDVDAAHDSQLMKIRCDDLDVDPRVQRKPLPGWIKKLRDNMDLDALGTLTISCREDESLIILDGQNRWRALLDLEMGDWEVDCKVYYGLSFETECRLFRHLNKERQISPFDDFVMAVRQGLDEYVHMQKICTDAGFRVAQSPGKTICCVRAIERVYAMTAKKTRAPGAILRDVLDVAVDAWGASHTSVPAPIVRGLGMFFDFHGDAVNKKRLTTALAKMPGGASGVDAAAQQSKLTFRRGDKPLHVAATITNAYNVGAKRYHLDRML